MKVTLGQRVYASKVFAWGDLTNREEGDEVLFAPVDNDRAGEVAVVVGESRRKYRGTVHERRGGYDVDGNIGEGVYVEAMTHRQDFIAIRYTLRGGRYFTTPEYLREADAHA